MTACEPLCAFSDRLYFTTFPHPPPPQDSLNTIYGSSDRLPPVRNPILSTSSQGAAKSYTASHYFTFDNALLYNSFYKDWGPLNLAMVYKACILIHELHCDEELSKHRLILYSSDNAQMKANAALIISLYSLVVMHSTPWDAFRPIAELEFMPFRDAGHGPSDFLLSIQDCLWGMWKAIQHGLCDMSTFSLEEYEYYEKVENGDWNWITPGFLAFASPTDPEYLRQKKEGHSGATALQRKLPRPFLNCLTFFEERGVKLVVRLNNVLYDRQTFLERSIDHVELFFEDGTNPSDEIVRSFLDMSDKIISAGGVVAVHCKAGLGRTGTLIGAYLIWKYGFTANEAIAFMRIARPGSVVGPQQQFMYVKQMEWSKLAATDEIRRAQQTNPLDAAIESDPVPTPAVPSTPPVSQNPIEIRENPPLLPPVTPSRNAVVSEAVTRSAVAPGQPRKTPRGKKTKTAITDISDEEDENDEISALPMADSRAFTSRLPRTTTKRKLPVTEHKRTAARRKLENAPLKRAFVDNEKELPNKAPRLGSRTVKRLDPPDSPSPTRPTRALSPVPSRLPQFNSNKLMPKARKQDAWMSENTQTVVTLGTKGVRPTIRAVRKRRSSFSSADVVV